MAARERDVREEEAGIESRLQQLEDGLGKTEQRLEALEDGAEDLRVEALRSDRTLLRLEAAGDARGRRTRRVPLGRRVTPGVANSGWSRR